MRWKDIEGYEGLYQVSDEGLVRSCDRYTTGKRHRLLRGCTLRQTPCYKNGNYLKVALCINGEAKDFRVHRLVADAFLPNPQNYKEINHKDFNPNNNHVSNLEWCTHTENIGYSATKGRFKNVHKRKFTDEVMKKIAEEYIPYNPQFSARALSKKYDCNMSTIYRILKSYLEDDT